MRKFGWLFAAVALAVPAGAIMAQSASAAGGTSCAKASGTATFTPSLFKFQSAAAAETHESTSTISSTGTTSSCSGGGVTSGYDHCDDQDCRPNELQQPR